MGRKLKPGESREFKDSSGVVGAYKVNSITSLQISSINKQSIRFELFNSKYILLQIPAEVISKIKPIKVTQKNALRLAYWILDNCRDEKLKP